MPNERDRRIDFFRGLALVFIFWDHVPRNPLALATVRNFGFSDAAVLAYGRIYQRDGYWVACVRMLRRAWVLYVVHIFLLALLMGLVFVANAQVETRDLVQEMGLGYFLANPAQALVDELLLRFKPNLMDPLPLYILLLLALPLLLPALLWQRDYLLGASLALYLLAPLFQWNLQAQPNGVWFFNPLAWQLLFVLGAAAALRMQNQPAAAARALGRQPLFIAAALYLVLAGLLTLLWNWPRLHDALIPRPLAEWLYPIDKTNLAPVRLLHFLALAYCMAKLLPAGAWLQHWAAQQLCRMGRYSPEVFCLGVLLAPLAEVANTLAGEGWLVRLGSALAGVALMAALGAWLELSKRLSQPQALVAPLGCA